MSRNINSILILAILLVSSCAAPAVQERPVRIEERAGLQFYTSLSETKPGKFTLLYFETEACAWCKIFEREMLGKEDVKASLSKNFVLVAIDADKHGDLVLKYNVPAIPTIILLGRDGNEMARLIYMIGCGGVETHDTFKSKIVSTVA